MKRPKYIPDGDWPWEWKWPERLPVCEVHRRLAILCNLPARNETEACKRATWIWRVWGYCWQMESEAKNPQCVAQLSEVELKTLQMLETLEREVYIH